MDAENGFDREVVRSRLTRRFTILETERNRLGASADSKTRVSVVIPHWKGRNVLRHCLLSLRKTTYSGYQIVVVDNGSSDGTRQMLEEEFPEVIVAASPVNLGFAAGCNLGIRSCHTPFVVLLNNDTEVDPGWLGPLVEAADRDGRIGAVQAKMRSLKERSRFDYCGAAGGEIDLFGYPFAWGRLFDTLEEDHGQYEEERDVFWASGAAVLLRQKALDKVGLLEESFFAHMEEIDLCWRLQWAGYRILVAPRSVVYHQTGGTLGSSNLRKMVLNHRNNLLMILRNHPSRVLFWLIPLRILLELMTIGGAFLLRQPKRAAAVLGGFLGVLRHWKVVRRGRALVRSVRAVSDSDILNRMYRGSIAINYYLRGMRRTTDFIERDR
jgi:GT2 family glycosyltransferase